MAQKRKKVKVDIDKEMKKVAKEKDPAVSKRGKDRVSPKKYPFEINYHMPPPKQTKEPRSRTFTRTETKGERNPAVPTAVRPFKNKGYDNPNKQGSSYSDASGSMHRQDFQDEYNNQKQQDPRATHSTLTRRTTNELNAKRARQANVAEDYRYEATMAQPVMRPSMQDIGDFEAAERAAKWRTEPDLFTHAGATKRTNKQFLSLSRFMNQLPPEMRQKLHEDAGSPGTPLTAGLDLTKETHGGVYAPSVRRRLQIVSRSLQQGSSLTEAYEKAAQDNRGRSLTGKAKPITGKEPEFNRAQGRAQKLVTTTDMRGPGFKFGVTGATINKMEQLREKLPETPDRDLYRMQQYQRMDVANEVMRNQRWAHETQKARILGDQGKEEGKNRVVFFTTSLGSPSASVPSDSLIGQYVIRQRKKFLGQEKVFKSSQMRGPFPDAVRDMHVVELGTGISLGAQGVVGAFQKSGWRAGKRKSPGYGKPVPVGSQIMYDSQGRPVYDNNGNIRFSEGATRQFDVGTDKDLGLRIFVG